MLEEVDFHSRWLINASYYVHLLCNKRWTNDIPMVGLVLKDPNNTFIVLKNEFSEMYETRMGQEASVDSVNVGDVSETKLTERQRKIKESPSMTAKQMSETLSVSRRTVERDLAVMREMGVIKREGKDNNGKWRLDMHCKEH